MFSILQWTLGILLLCQPNGMPSGVLKILFPILVSSYCSACLVAVQHCSAWGLPEWKQPIKIKSLLCFVSAANKTDGNISAGPQSGRYFKATLWIMFEELVVWCACTAVRSSIYLYLCTLSFWGVEIQRGNGKVEKYKNQDSSFLKAMKHTFYTPRALPAGCWAAPFPSQYKLEK